MNIQNIISFYKDCYYEDNHKTFLKDIFHKEVHFRSFFKKEELINGKYPYVPISNDYAKDLKKSLHLYQKEKDLVYGSILLNGVTFSEENEKNFYCTPLFLWKAKLKEIDENHFVELNFDSLELNQSIIEILAKEDLQSDFDELSEEVSSSEYITYPLISKVIHHIEKYVEKIDILDIGHFPSLISETDLKKNIKSIKLKRSNYSKIIPASFLAIVKKTSEAKGVLGELDLIVNKKDLSRPLLKLFSGDSFQTVNYNKGFVPAILSSSQEKVFKSASSSINTLVIGPPGTGKSYTISSLALEYLSKGKSVLVVSKMDHAVNVIANKIEEQLNIKGSVVRGGKSTYLKELKTFVSDLLNGYYNVNDVSKDTITQLKKDVSKLQKELKKLESRIVKSSQREVRNGSYVVLKNSFLSKVKKKYIKQRQLGRKSLWDIHQEYDKALVRKINALKVLLNQLNTYRLSTSAKKYRTVLQNFLKAIRARTGLRQESFFRKTDLRKLLEIFPIWLTNLSDIHRVLPLQSELFDVVIIDEASQCDIASCIPVFQRAKRVVVVGDPKQLKHISFISQQKQKEFLNKNNLSDLDLYDYRKQSILDFFAYRIEDQKNVIFLNEHYRSLPQIINFSNAQFYDNRLHIMTEKPLKYFDSPVELCFVEGVREKSGINRIEADKIVSDVQYFIENNDSKNLRIGILSPFRKQVDYISNQLIDLVGLEKMKKHQVLIGTLIHFKEKNVMSCIYHLV